MDNGNKTPASFNNNRSWIHEITVLGDGGWWLTLWVQRKKRQAEILISRVVFVAVHNIRKRPSIVFNEITHETVAHRIDFFVRSWDRHRIE